MKIDIPVFGIWVFLKEDRGIKLHKNGLFMHHYQHKTVPDLINIKKCLIFCNFYIKKTLQIYSFCTIIKT